MVDTSLATRAPHDDPMLKRIKRLAHAYLDTLATGDEVSVLSTGSLAGASADPVYDLAAAHRAVDQLESTSLSCDIPSLIEAGLDRLGHHLNPEAELVVVSAGRAQAFDLDNASRWRALAGRLDLSEGSGVGTRERPHLILLHPPAPSSTLENCSVDALALDRTLIPTLHSVELHAQLHLEGPRPLRGLLARLNVDGRPVAEQACDLAPGESRSLAFTYASPTPGSHLLEVSIEGARDALPEDDHRAVAVEVAQRLPALLVEGSPGEGVDGSLGKLAAGLAPSEEERLFSITRVGVSSVDEQALAHARLVVLGDVPALDERTVARLERFMSAGGGILVVAGPLMEGDTASRFFWRGGDGFLPARLGVEHELAAGERLALASGRHGALSELAQDSPRSFPEVSLVRAHELDELSPDAEQLLTTSSGTVIGVARQRGRGRVALIATALDGSWNDLPYRAPFVPLMRSLCAWLGGELLPPRNLMVGEHIACLGADAPTPGALHLAGPDLQEVPLSPSSWEGYPAVASPRLLLPGTYTLTGGQEPTVFYQVACDPGESRLLALDEEALGKALEGVPRHEVHDPARVSELFSAAGDRTWDLWQPLGVAAAALLLLESLCTMWIARPSGPQAGS